MKLSPLMILAVIAVVGVVLTLAFMSAAIGGAMPAWSLVIPLAVTVLAGIAALVLWGMRQQRP